MKRTFLPIASIFLLAGISACNNEEGTSTTTTDSTSVTTNTTTTDNNATTTTTPTNTQPLGTEDSLFVMKAAVGGIMEVEAGNIAQQNAQSERVKSFAAMMVNDHSKANQELMSLVSGRGITLPTSLPEDIQKHLDAMRNMKGKSFDDHYMKMMVDDHKKDVGAFEKQANSGTDADLKAWAAKTLPTLQMHRDSAVAIHSKK